MTKPRPATTVGERMAIEPIVVRADATLTEAARLLDTNHISGLPVVDGSGSLVGVLSQTDLARARATEYLWANWPGLAVRHLMTTPPVTVAWKLRVRKGELPVTGEVLNPDKLPPVPPSTTETLIWSRADDMSPTVTLTRYAPFGRSTRKSLLVPKCPSRSRGFGPTRSKPPVGGVNQPNPGPAP